MKKMILPMAILGVFLILTQAFCAELTEKEWQILYDDMEGQLDLAGNPSMEAVNAQEMKILERHGLVSGQLADLWAKAATRPLTESERAIVGEVNSKIDDSRDYSWDNFAKVCKEVAKAHGMRPGKVGYMTRLKEIPAALKESQ